MRHAEELDSNTPFLLRCLALSLLLHLVATFLSQGFFHSDEHFQILEFVGWKLGITSQAGLPIEFGEKMRPWLEPGLFYGIAQVGKFLGLPAISEAPFGWSLGFRLLSSLLGWSSVVALALCCRHWFTEQVYQRAAILSLTLLWYVPAFHARLSSENWGGATFILGLCLFLLKRVYQKRSLSWGLLCGFLFGLAFEFRYQVGVMVAGAFLWLWFRARIGWRDSVALLTGLCGAIALSTWIDAWGYGEWVFAPWNYVDFNLIQGKVGAVDTDPWWDLFRRAFTESWPLLGFLLLLSLPVAWITHPFHVLTWTHLPFFLTHAVIGHKELRFLFPMLHAAPVLLIMAAQGIRLRLPFGFRIIIRLLIAWNMLALFITTAIPAWMPIRFLEQTWHFQEGRAGAAITFHWKDKSPYDVSGSPMSFYRPQGIRLARIASYASVHDELKPDEIYWLFYDGFVLQGEAEALKNDCKLEFQAFPKWVSSVASELHLTRFFRHVTNYSLYRCQKGLSDPVAAEKHVSQVDLQDDREHHAQARRARPG